MAGEPALLDVVVRDQFGDKFAGGSGLVVCNRFRWVARGALPGFRGWLTKMIYSGTRRFGSVRVRLADGRANPQVASDRDRAYTTVEVEAPVQDVRDNYDGSHTITWNPVCHRCTAVALFCNLAHLCWPCRSLPGSTTSCCGY